MSVDLPGAGADRRAAQRESIRRRVVFAGVRGEGLLRQGMAVDISASGLLIHTPQPDQPGRHLEIELHPDGIEAPGDVIMVRGEVVWTRPHEVKGEFAMGVRFLQSFPATDMTGAGYRPATRDEATELAASIQRRLAAMEPAVRVEISEAARRRAPAPSTPPTKPSDARRSWRWLWWLLLLLGFGSVVSTATIATLWQLGVYRSKPAPPAVDEKLPALPETRDTSSGPDPSAIVNERIEAALESGTAYYVNRGSLFLIQGRFPAAAQAFSTAQARPEATPLERFIAELGEAQALASDDKVDEALEILARPWEEKEGIPQPWQALREEFLAVLSASPESEEARAPLVNAFAFQPAEATGESGAPGSANDALRVEIDTNRHLLTVLENNTIKAVYPIGLGARGKTPEGDFSILNKIENPEWYNQGNPIPAGDPENELGSRWIGLADESGPTPVGIHATDELDSIGANQSRGCIRMRPEDVEELFTFVTVGTPVSIRAL